MVSPPGDNLFRTGHIRFLLFMIMDSSRLFLNFVITLICPHERIPSCSVLKPVFVAPGPGWGPRSGELMTHSLSGRLPGDEEANVNGAHSTGQQVPALST